MVAHRATAQRAEARAVGRRTKPPANGDGRKLGPLEIDVDPVVSIEQPPMAADNEIIGSPRGRDGYQLEFELTGRAFDAEFEALGIAAEGELSHLLSRGFERRLDGDAECGAVFATSGAMAYQSWAETRRRHSRLTEAAPSPAGS